MGEETANLGRCRKRSTLYGDRLLYVENKMDIVGTHSDLPHGGGGDHRARRYGTRDGFLLPRRPSRELLQSTVRHPRRYIQGEGVRPTPPLVVALTSGDRKSDH